MHVKTYIMNWNIKKKKGKQKKMRRFSKVSAFQCYCSLEIWSTSAKLVQNYSMALATYDLHFRKKTQRPSSLLSLSDSEDSKYTGELATMTEHREKWLYSVSTERSPKAGVKINQPTKTNKKQPDKEWPTKKQHASIRFMNHRHC